MLSTIHMGLAWIVLAAVVAQFFFAGLGLFTTAGFGAHRLIGSLTVPVSLVLLLLALAGRLGRLRIGLSAALFGLTLVQSLLIRGPGLVAALHPVNAIAILYVAQRLAVAGRRMAHWPAPDLSHASATVR
ncbi:MAG TPA: DUF6220 domain-containing protein [Thermomicrobiales bacterium]